MKGATQRGDSPRKAFLAPLVMGVLRRFSWRRGRQSALPRRIAAATLCSLSVFLAPAHALTEETDHDAIPARFNFNDLDGNTHRLSDYRGQWVIVNFWATWCAPCVHEIPELNRFYRRYRERGVAMLGVNYEELSAQQVKLALQAFKIDYTVLRLGEDSDMSEAMVLKGLPATFVISPRGELLKTWLGAVTEERLEAYLGPKIEAGP